MSLFTAAAVLALAPSLATAEPRYTVEILSRQSPSGLRILAMNAHGDFVSSNSHLSQAARLNGTLVEFPAGLSDRGWRSEAVWDVSDRGIVLGAALSQGAGSSIYVATSTAIEHTPISLVPWATAHMGFINGRGDIIFHAHPQLQGRLQNMNAFRLAGGRPQPLPVGDAQGSQVTFLSEQGHTCGVLLFGDVSSTGNLTVRRRRAAVWTKENELVGLREFEGWKDSWAMALSDRNLVYGFAILENGRTVTVAWRNGEPELLAARYGNDIEAGGIAPDGSVIGDVIEQRGTTASRAVGNEIKPLLSLVNDPPPGAQLDSVLDVASDGSILVHGKIRGAPATFRLRPTS